MREISAMLIMVMIVTMPLASAAQTTYTSLSASQYRSYISSGDSEYASSNFVGEAINVYVDHYEPTVLTSDLIEQDDVPVFVFLRANTLGSFLGVEGSAGEPLYGTPNIRNIIPKVVNGSKYVKSVNYVPPSELRMDYAQLSREGGQNLIDSVVGGLNTVYQETVDAGGRVLDTRGLAYSSDVSVTNDLSNLGMMVIRLGQIPKEADVPEYIDLTLSADVYFNTDRSLSYGQWTMPLREYSETEWLKASGYDSSGLLDFLGLGTVNARRVINSLIGKDPGGEAIGANLLGDEFSFLYGKGYLRASKIEKDKATISVYDGSLNNLGQTTLKVGGEESRFFSLQGVYGNTNEGVRLRLREIVDPDESFVVMDIIVEDEIKREMLRKGDFLYDGSRWKVREIVEEGEDVRVIIMDSLNQKGDLEITAKVSGQTQGTVEGDGGDPCLVSDYFSTGNYNEEDPIKLYCSAVNDLRDVIEQYADVIAEKETGNEQGKYYGDLARYKISDAYFQIAEVFEAKSYIEQSNQEEYQKKASTARKIALDEAGYISDAALFREAVQKIENKIFSPPQTLDDLGKRITARVVNVYGKDSGGIRVSVNGAQSLLTEGSEIGESGYVIEDIKQNEIIIKKKEVEDKAFDWDYTFRGKVSDTSATGSVIAIDSVTGAAVDEGTYDEIIYRYAIDYFVEYALIKAIIKQESNFDLSRYELSPCGAVGLMQLMPDTAEELGLNVPDYEIVCGKEIYGDNLKPCDDSEFGNKYKNSNGNLLCDHAYECSSLDSSKCDRDNDERFDVNKNIETGTKLLNKLLNKYEAKLPAAVAAYIGGEGNVDDAIKNGWDGKTYDYSTLNKYFSGPNTRKYIGDVMGFYKDYSGTEPDSADTSTEKEQTTSGGEVGEIKSDFEYVGDNVDIKVEDNLLGDKFPELEGDKGSFKLRVDIEDRNVVVYEVYSSRGKTSTYPHTVGYKSGDEVRLSDLKDANDETYDLIVRIDSITSNNNDYKVKLKFIMRYEEEGDEIRYKRGSYKHTLSGTNYEVVFPTRSTNSVAIVDVIPGMDDVVSKSEFYIRIPIEKRAFNLTDEQIDSYLDTTNKTIEKLDGIIETLDKVVESWKKICVYTYFFVMAKSLLLGGKSGAREAVIQGYDGKHGWKEYCQREVASGEYGTYDDCIFDNSDLINNQIEEFDKSMSEFNSEVKDSEGDITQTTAYADLKEEFSSLENAGELRTLVISNADIKKYLYYKSVGQDEENNPFSGEFEKLKEEIKSKDESFQKAWNLVNSDGTQLEDEEKEKVLRTLYRDIQNDKTEKKQSSVESEGILRTGVIEDIKFYAQTLLDSKGDNVKSIKIKSTLSNVFIDQAGQVKSYEIEDSKYETLNLVPVANKEIEEDSWYLFNLAVYDAFEAGIKDVAGIVKTRAEISGGVDAKDLLKKLVDEFHDGTIGVVTDLVGDYTSRSERTMEILGMSLYRTSEKNSEGSYDYYLVLNENRPADETSGYSFNTKNLVAQFYPDGKPYCVPYDRPVKIEGKTYENGLFLMVRDFYNDGGAKDIQLWNVGPDGELCSGDDNLLLHESVLTNSAQYKSQRNIFLAYLQNLRCKDGGTIKTGKGEFICKANAANKEISVGQTHCTDVMSTGDCKLIFNVCDPVMCPVSRFNLGGKWYVKDVIQSGFIGSIVLGLPNWDSDQVIPPVCLSGIDASFKNLKSIFEGVHQCLLSAKTTGQSVGICDRVRSLFICEVMWKEGMSIMDILTGFLGGNSGDVGGGEYINFKSNFDNAGDSLNYFVNEYSTTVNKAYRSRSLSEFGTEVCKSAIHGKIPGLGDIVDQLSQPSDPPQFTAFVTESSYSETAEASKYSVYYHIYAGTDGNPYTGYDGITYSIYLVNDESDVYYVTDGKCGSTSKANVPSGDMVDKNVDCVAPEGFNQICIDINGERECGFGKVTSAFSLDWVNDQLVKNEVNKEIDSEEECISDSSVLGTSLGINRVCSTVVPGDADDWVAIGSCGTDSQGRSLGECWISRKSIDIKHEGDEAEVTEKLDELQKEYEKLRKARESGANVSDIRSGADAEAEVENIISETSGEPTKRIEKLRNFISVSISREANARALYVIAKEFSNKAESLAKPIIEEGSEKKKEAREKVSAVNTVAKDIDEWIDLFSAILSEEEKLIKAIRSGTRKDHVDSVYEEFSRRTDSLLVQATTLADKAELAKGGISVEEANVLAKRVSSKKQDIEKFKSQIDKKVEAYNDLIDIMVLFSSYDQTPSKRLADNLIEEINKALTNYVGTYESEDLEILYIDLLKVVYDFLFRGLITYSDKESPTLEECNLRNNYLMNVLDREEGFEEFTFRTQRKDQLLNVFNIREGIESNIDEHMTTFDGIKHLSVYHITSLMMEKAGDCYYQVYRHQYPEGSFSFNEAKNAYLVYYESILRNLGGSVYDDAFPGYSSSLDSIQDVVGKIRFRYWEDGCGKLQPGIEEVAVIDCLDVNSEFGKGHFRCGAVWPLEVAPTMQCGSCSGQSVRDGCSSYNIPVDPTLGGLWDQLAEDILDTEYPENWILYINQGNVASAYRSERYVNRVKRTVTAWGGDFKGEEKVTDFSKVCKEDPCGLGLPGGICTTSVTSGYQCNYVKR